MNANDVRFCAKSCKIFSKSSNSIHLKIFQQKKLQLILKAVITIIMIIISANYKNKVTQECSTVIILLVVFFLTCILYNERNVIEVCAACGKWTINFFVRIVHHAHYYGTTTLYCCCYCCCRLLLLYSRDDLFWVVLSLVCMNLLFDIRDGVFVYYMNKKWGSKETTHSRI